MNNTVTPNVTSPPGTNIGQSCTSPEPVNRDVQAVLYAWVIVMSVIGNSLVIFVVIRNKRMHTVANYLICNMSVADLLITLFPMIWDVVKVIHYPGGEWPMGRFMCTFIHMATYLSVACSTLSLIVITCDRFFAIMLPLKRVFTKKILPGLLIAIWLGSLAFASPTIYAMDIYKFNGKDYCLEFWKPPFDAKNSPMHYTVILFVGLYALPLLTMTVMYSIMSWRLWKRNIPGNHSSETEKQHVKQKKKVIRMLVVVISAFAICWLPVFVQQFMFFVHPYYSVCTGSIPPSFVFFAFFMQYLASAINPYIYFICSDAYRHGIRNAVFRNRVGPGQMLTSRVVTENKRPASTMPSASRENAAPTQTGKLQPTGAWTLAKK